MEVITDSWPKQVKPETRVIIYDSYLFLTTEIAIRLDSTYRRIHVFKKIRVSRSTLKLLPYRIQENEPWENTVLLSEEFRYQRDPDYQMYDLGIRLLTDLRNFPQYGDSCDLNFKW